MIIKECAFCSKETLTGLPSEGSCNLSFDGIRFYDCETVPISKCPFKVFAAFMIDKEELNKRIMERMR